MASVTMRYNSSNRTSASVTCTASGFIKPSNKALTPQYSNYSGGGANDSSESRRVSGSGETYGNLTYEWSFSSGNSATGSSTTHSYTGLSTGTSNRVTATVIAYSQVTRSSYSGTQSRSRDWIDPPPPAEGESPGQGHWGSWSSWSPSLDSLKNESTRKEEIDRATGSLTVYTQPAQFSWSRTISRGQTIQTNLTASDWNALVTTAEKRTNWKNQSGGTSYSGDKVSKGDLLTASKYNSLAGHCGSSNRVSGGGTNGTIITAALLNALVTSVNT